VIFNGHKTSEFKSAISKFVSSDPPKSRRLFGWSLKKTKFFRLGRRHQCGGSLMSRFPNSFMSRRRLRHYFGRGYVLNCQYN